jgi:hypothetical protein
MHLSTNTRRVHGRGMKLNGATDTLIAQNTIVGNWNGFGCNGALVGNHVLTSDTDDLRSARLASYGAGNVTFFAAPPANP